MSAEGIADVRRAFYALCTHIDAQIRLVIGTLREEKLLDNTIIMITSDHGDMLGDFGLFAKRLMYENSARVPMILLGTKEDKIVGKGEVSNRLVGLADIMPTLLDLAKIKIPSSCDGQSMFHKNPRTFLYAEANENINATRMVTSNNYKLVWYPYGNSFQFFDLINDPKELEDVYEKSKFQSHIETLKNILIKNLYGKDLSFIKEGKLIGISSDEIKSDDVKTGLGLLGERELLGQRGLQYPPPPIDQ
jgi:arylsulfatase A-like enzyme